MGAVEGATKLERTTMLGHKKTANGVKAWQANDEKPHQKGFVDFHKELGRNCFCADVDIVEGRFLFGQFGICALYEVTTLHNLDYPNLTVTRDIFARMRKFQLPMYYLLGQITGLPTFILACNKDATCFARLDVMTDNPEWQPMTKEEVVEWVRSMVPGHCINVPDWIKKAGRTREECETICHKLLEQKLITRSWQEPKDDRPKAKPQTKRRKRRKRKSPSKNINNNPSKSG